MAEMKCNNCGAPFANVTEKTEVTCAFCGTKQTLQPEVRRKYTAKLAGKIGNEPISTPAPQTIAPGLNSDTSKSQTSASEPYLTVSESRTKTLHEYFLDACEYYGILGDFDERIEQAKKHTSDIEQNSNRELLKVTRTVGKSSVAGNIKIIGIVVCVSFLLALIFIGIGTVYSIGMIELLSLASPILCLVLCLKHTKKIRAENEPLVQQAKAQWIAEHGGDIETAKIELQKLIECKENFIYSHYKAIDFLPPDYREPYSVYCMERLVRNGQAESLKEAMNLFEELMHKARLEANSAQMLEQTERLQRQLAQWRIENNVHSIINHAQMSALNRNVRDIYDKLDQ